MSSTTRVPIAGPGVPTAASFTQDDTPAVDPGPPVPLQRRRRRVPSLHMSAPPTGPADLEPEPEQALTVSGHVVTTRGRGLSGITVNLVDASGETASSTVTGRRGRFVLEDLTPGTYHLSALDQIDGDHADVWFGGTSADTATPVQVQRGHATTDVEIALPARVVIEAEVDTDDTRAVVDLAVTDRTSGLPAKGSVVVSTEHFSAEIPLVKGRTSITVIDSSPQRLRVHYLGTRHTASHARSIRLG